MYAHISLEGFNRYNIIRARFVYDPHINNNNNKSVYVRL